MSSKATGLSNRIEKAANIIEPYFTEPKFLGGVDVIRAALKKLEVDDTEDGLSLLKDEFISFEDFHQGIKIELNVLGDIADIPIPRLKRAWSILKEQNKENKETTTDLNADFLATLAKTIKPIPQWSNLELLNQYVKEGQFAIHEELARRVKDRFVIMFNEDGSVDIENSLNMIKKAQFQETPQVYKLRSGELREVYRVGDFPLQVFYECPIHKDVLLLDNYCEECTTHWELEDNERNVFFRLLMDGNKSLDFRLYKDKSLTELKSLFPKVYLDYIFLGDEGKLPSLKRRISKPKQGDPFRVIGTNKVY
jgi:hypothetical protein